MFSPHNFTWWLIQALNVVIRISSVIKRIDKINSVAPYMLGDMHALSREACYRMRKSVYRSD